MRSCCIAGCTHRLFPGEFFVCGRCWKQYVRDGEVPEWLRELIHMAAAELRRDRLRQRYEVSLDSFENTDDIFAQYTTSATGNKPE